MEILTYPHPILRFKTRKITKVDANVRKCADEMLEVMQAEKGIGLSSNQVGLPLRMFVINWQETELCLINPVVKPFGKTKAKEEGCLSFPDVFVQIKRRATCHVTAYDLYGDDIDEDISGDLARVVMHEMDHLDGMLFIDRLTELQRRYSQLGSHLAAMEKSWLTYGSKREFPADDFNEILYEYCDVERPV